MFGLGLDQRAHPGAMFTLGERGQPAVMIATKIRYTADQPAWSAGAAVTGSLGDDVSATGMYAAPRRTATSKVS